MRNIVVIQTGGELTGDQKDNRRHQKDRADLAGKAPKHKTILPFLRFLWSAEMYLGHHAAEVFGVVGGPIEVFGVEEEGLGCCQAGSVDNDIRRLATAERQRIGLVVHVVAVIVAQQSRIERDHFHRQPAGAERVEFGDVQVGNSQQDALARCCRDQAVHRLRRPIHRIR